MNGWQDQFVRPDGLVGDDLSPTLAGQLGVDQAGAARRGYAEALDEQTSTSPVNMPTVTLGATGSFYQVFYELDLRVTSASSSVAVQLFDGALNLLTANTYSASVDYVTVNPRGFLIITAVPASNAFTLRVSVPSGTYSVKNVRLWAICYAV